MSHCDYEVFFLNILMKTIVIRVETDELLKKLRVGDESYNSIIWRNLKEKIAEVSVDDRRE